MESKDVCIRKRIIAKDGWAEIFYDDLSKIDFIPFVGMCVEFDEDGFGYEVKNVTWSFIASCWFLDIDEDSVFADDTGGCLCGPEDDCCTIKNDVSRYMKEGWDLKYAIGHDWRARSNAPEDHTRYLPPSYFGFPSDIVTLADLDLSGGDKE